jgi:hypothetical protein
MTMLDARARGDLAEELLPVAARLATIVQGDGGPEDVQELLESLDSYKVGCLAVVLAGLVDPDRPLGALWGWVDFDEHGNRVSPDQSEQQTLRDLTEEAPGRVLVDEVAVERALSSVNGIGVRLSREERRLGVDRGIRRGLSYEQVAERLGMSVDAVKRAWERAKDRARAEGRYVPAQPVGQISNVA